VRLDEVGYDWVRLVVLLKKLCKVGFGVAGSNGIRSITQV
jgi:hypothetical protein